MYSTVVYDYFNSNPKKFKFQPNRLTRKNAFKKKTTKKTVVLPKKSNTPTGTLRSSSQIEDTSQKPKQITESRSAVSVVYDTVQCIWKYAKSFLSNQNSDSNKHQDRLSKKIKCRSGSSKKNLKSPRKVSYKTFPRDISDENKKSYEPIKASNTKSGIENFTEETEVDLIENAAQHTKEDNEDFLTIEKLATSTNIQELEAQSITEINETNFNNLETHSVSKELENESTSVKISIKKNQSKKTISKIYDKQENLQNNIQDESENLAVVEVQLKSSLKTYGRGKRRNKKLHVHFIDDYDNKKRKYSSYISKILRKSDCYHPNAFLKKRIKKHTPQKKKSTHSIGGKKRRLALCTKSRLSSLKKKKSKHCPYSNISSQSKSSNTHENKAEKKTGKIPKKYSVYATTKIYKRKRGKKCKKAITTADTKLDEAIHISSKDTNKIQKAINNNEFCNCKHSKYLQQPLRIGDDILFGKNQDVFASNNLLENN